MKKDAKSRKKLLTLGKETVKQLGKDELERAVGGTSSCLPWPPPAAS